MNARQFFLDTDYESIRDKEKNVNKSFGTGKKWGTNEKDCT